MDWFSPLFGFRETDYEITKSKFSIAKEQDADTGMEELFLISKDKKDTKFGIGRFYYPQLGNLRQMTEQPMQKIASGNTKSSITFTCMAADVQSIHGDPDNKFCTIQVASQFNCLEFVDPGVKPESGVTQYNRDRTQGPACCLCTGPAIVYRNYLHAYEDDIVVLRDSKTEPGDVGSTKNRTPPEGPIRGQRYDRQADMLADFGRAIGNVPDKKGVYPYWDMIGGYTMSDKNRLSAIPWNQFHENSEAYDKLLSLIRIGIHEDIQVTHCGGFGAKTCTVPMKVTHCLSSAVPVAYNRARSKGSDWEPLARSILMASYEACFHAAVMNMVRHGGKQGSRKLFLTSVGGGVFGNRSRWINDAIKATVEKFKHVHLEVVLVCFGNIDEESRRLESEICEKIVLR